MTWLLGADGPELPEELVAVTVKVSETRPSRGTNAVVADPGTVTEPARLPVTVYDVAGDGSGLCTDQLTEAPLSVDADAETAYGASGAGGTGAGCRRTGVFVVWAPPSPSRLIGVTAK